MTTAQYRLYVGELKRLARPGQAAAHEQILHRQTMRLAASAGKTLAGVAAAAGVGLLGAWALSQREPALLAKK